MKKETNNSPGIIPSPGIDQSADTVRSIPRAERRENTRTNRTSKKGRKQRTTKSLRPPEAESSERAKWSRRAFPQNTLKDALQIPQAIKDKTNGNPCDTELVAKAVNSSKQGAKFYYLCASARDYGLTIGSRDTTEIALDEIGRAIVFAPDSASRRHKQIEAFFRIEKFKKVFDFYGGSNAMPEGEFVSNVLNNQFGLDASEHDEFIDLFKKNCEFLEIAEGLAGVPVPSNANGKQDSVDITIVGQPRGKFERTAFVIMPFGEKGAAPRPKGFFDEVLKSLITPAGNAAKFAVETARREGSDVIHHTIINQLIQAELVIADLTDHNPSVLFELGIRIALKKPVCLIKAEGTGPVFDVDNLMRVLPYNPNLWTSTVQTDVLRITDHINGAWVTKDSDSSYMSILTAPHAASAA